MILKVEYQSHNYPNIIFSRNLNKIDSRYKLNLILKISYKSTMMIHIPVKMIPVEEAKKVKRTFNLGTKARKRNIKVVHLQVQLILKER